MYARVTRGQIQVAKMEEAIQTLHEGREIPSPSSSPKQGRSILSSFQDIFEGEEESRQSKRKAVREELVKRGVDVSEIDVREWGPFVYVRDPDGHRWSLQQLPSRT